MKALQEHLLEWPGDESSFVKALKKSECRQSESKQVIAAELIKVNCNFLAMAKNRVTFQEEMKVISTLTTLKVLL